MKKIISLFVIAIMAVALIACDDGQEINVDAEFDRLFAQVVVPGVIGHNVTGLNFFTVDGIDNVEGLESVSWAVTHPHVVCPNTGAVTPDFVDINKTITFTAVISGVERSSIRTTVVLGTGGDAIFDTILTGLMAAVPPSARDNFILPLTFEVIEEGEVLAAAEDITIRWSTSDVGAISFPNFVAYDATELVARVNREYVTNLVEVTASVTLNGFTRSRSREVAVGRYMDLTGAAFQADMGSVDGGTGTPVGLHGNNTPRPQYVIDLITGDQASFGLWNAGRTSLNTPENTTTPFRMQIGSNLTGNGNLAHNSGFRTNFIVEGLNRVHMEFGISNTAANRNNFLTNFVGDGSLEDRGVIDLQVSADGVNWVQAFDVLGWMIGQFTVGGNIVPHSAMMELHELIENPFARAYLRLVKIVRSGQTEAVWSNIQVQSLILYYGAADNDPAYISAASIAGAFIPRHRYLPIPEGSPEGTEPVREDLPFSPAAAVLAISNAAGLDALNRDAFNALTHEHRMAIVGMLEPVLIAESGVGIATFLPILTAIHAQEADIYYIDVLVDLINFAIERFIQIEELSAQIAAIEDYSVLTQAMVNDLLAAYNALTTLQTADATATALRTARYNVTNAGANVTEAQLRTLQNAILAYLEYRAANRLQLELQSRDATTAGAAPVYNNAFAPYRAPLRARIDALQAEIDDMKLTEAFLVQLIDYVLAAIEAATYGLGVNDEPNVELVFDALMLVGFELTPAAHYFQTRFARVPLSTQLRVVGIMIDEVADFTDVSVAAFIQALHDLIDEQITVFDIAAILISAITSGSVEDVIFWTGILEDAFPIANYHDHLDGFVDAWPLLRILFAQALIEELADDANELFAALLGGSTAVEDLHAFTEALSEVFVIPAGLAYSIRFSDFVRGTNDAGAWVTTPWTNHPAVERQVEVLNSVTGNPVLFSTRQVGTGFTGAANLQVFEGASRLFGMSWGFTDATTGITNLEANITTSFRVTGLSLVELEFAVWNGAGDITGFNNNRDNFSFVVETSPNGTDWTSIRDLTTDIPVITGQPTPAVRVSIPVTTTVPVYVRVRIIADERIGTASTRIAFNFINFFTATPVVE